MQVRLYYTAVLCTCLLSPSKVSPPFCVQMVSYKIIKADNGDAWVEVNVLPVPTCSSPFILLPFWCAYFQDVKRRGTRNSLCRLEESHTLLARQELSSCKNSKLTLSHTLAARSQRL